MQTATPRAGLLAQAGKALYGPRWISPLGQSLGMTNGTFRPLATGRREIPASIWPEILGFVVARQRELQLAATELKLQIAQDKARQLGTIARQIRDVIRSPPGSNLG